MYYTGIGSRETPIEIQYLMSYISKLMHSKGYILRSGGANGADLAFETLISDKKEIYLPWKNFNDSLSPLYSVSKEAFELASTLHPNWKSLSEGAKKLMARNCYQILGANLDTPSAVVICWTPDGCTSHSSRTSKTGGTGQAISLASLYDIPIYNLANYKDIVQLLTSIQHVKDTNEPT